MSLPYERTQEIELEADNTVVAFPFPSRTSIEKILIKQVGGTDAGTLDVFNKNPETLEVGDPEAVYKVCERQTITSGALEKFFSPQPGFYNHDAPDATGRNPRLIYLRFNGISSGTFVVTIGATSDMN